jgi:hypothetical protein
MLGFGFALSPIALAFIPDRAGRFHDSQVFKVHRPTSGPFARI